MRCAAATKNSKILASALDLALDTMPHTTYLLWQPRGESANKYSWRLDNATESPRLVFHKVMSLEGSI